MTEPENLPQALEKARRYLFILEEQAAAFGLYPPRKILIEIQDITTIIAELQTLTETPFCLNRLLTYFVATSEIPANPARLLAYSVDMALNAEIAKGLLKAEEKEELIERLSLLAFNMTDDGENSTNPAQAAGWLFHLRDQQLPSWRKKMLNLTTDTEPHATTTEHQQAQTKLNQAQDCGLITIQNDQVKFAQPWLQEYFCALFLQKQELSKRWLDRLVISPFEEFWPMWAGMDNTLVDRLLGWLQASDNKERLIIIALGKIGDPRAVEPLLQTLKDENEDAHYLATRALGKIGDTRALEPLILALNNGDDFLRSFAAAALGKIGDARAVEPLIMALKDAVINVRSAAAWALRIAGDTRAVEPLILSLNDEKEDVRYLAAEALGKIGDARALPELERLALEDKSEIITGEKVSDAATTAIEQIKVRQIKTPPP